MKDKSLIRVQNAKLPKEDDFTRMKRNLEREEESASYCCEAASMIPAEKLPPEDAY